MVTAKTSKTRCLQRSVSPHERLRATLRPTSPARRTVTFLFCVTMRISWPLKPFSWMHSAQTWRAKCFECATMHRVRQSNAIWICFVRKIFIVAEVLFVFAHRNGSEKFSNLIEIYSAGDCPLLRLSGTNEPSESILFGHRSGIYPYSIPTPLPPHFDTHVSLMWKIRILTETNTVTVMDYSIPNGIWLSRFRIIWKISRAVQYSYDSEGSKPLSYQLHVDCRYITWYTSFHMISL